jgi:hypothetical protein
MKTTEEKAKAYDEVVNKLRHFIAKGVDPLITRADVQDFFPELAESEGEKVIKRITLCLEECVHSDVIRDYEKDECTAWLEKQKGIICGISPNSAWSEEDKGIIEEVVSYLINYSNIVESKEDANRIEYLIDKIQDICPHQKQEWSEEDEQHIDSLLKRLEGMCKKGATYTATRFAVSQDIDWLKSLKGRVQPQPKQEWSEEDEHRIKDTIYFLDTAKKHYASTEELDACIDWLKSLRPQNRWKPSSEQIGLLQAIINEPNNAASESCQIVLREVLEQLKKLKKE